MSEPLPDSAYVPALWQHPNLCLGLFGVQLLTEEGRLAYAAAAIEEQIAAALAQTPEGFLLHRVLISPEGPLILAYWRSYEAMRRWARRQPHSLWWLWLMQHRDQGVGFYHEVYQIGAAEAIYQPGTLPVGPALFCDLEAAPAGQGQSRRRLRRFRDARPASDQEADPPDDSPLPVDGT